MSVLSSQHDFDSPLPTSELRTKPGIAGSAAATQVEVPGACSPNCSFLEGHMESIPTRAPQSSLLSQDSHQTSHTLSHILTLLCANPMKTSRFPDMPSYRFKAPQPGTSHLDTGHSLYGQHCSPGFRGYELRERSDWPMVLLPTVTITATETRMETWTDRWMDTQERTRARE